MATLTVIEFLTLDGVMQGFGGPDEDRRGGFEHGGWGRPYMDERQFGAAVEALPETSAYVFGRRTYEHMAAHWPYEPDDNPMAAHLNAAPKFVASRTLRELTWHNAELLGADLDTSVRELKARYERRIAVLGSGELVRQLIALDLVDGYQLFIHPLVLGSGHRLFDGVERPQRLRLVDEHRRAHGVLPHGYGDVNAATPLATTFTSHVPRSRCRRSP